MDRRQLIKLSGASLGVLAGGGALAGYALLPRRSAVLEPTDVLARRLFAALDADQRAAACVDYDDPWRQYHNRGGAGGGAEIGFTSFTREQRQLLTDLFHAGLSTQGRERVPEQFFLNWPGIHLMRVLIAGDPHAPPYQIILTGPHLNLRLGGASREGVAFGGPQVYGDQRGNERRGLPGNVYRYQLELAQRLLESLDATQRGAAVLVQEPIQTQVELQGRAGVFPGVPVAGLDAPSKLAVHAFVEAVLENYAAADAAFARECLAQNGGVDGLSASWYSQGEAGETHRQVFRLEGPAAVFHYRGHPHLHAFLNIAMDGEHPLSVGEELGNNPTVLEGARVQRLFEAAMAEATEADLAFYEPEAVVGRLRAGTIRTGDIYNLESWLDRVALVTVRGKTLRPELVARLEQRGATLELERLYRVACTGYVAGNEAAEKLGSVASRESVLPALLVRDATIAWLRRHGFPRS